MIIYNFFKKITLKYKQLYNSTWVCTYRSNIVGAKKGSFLCNLTNFEDVENYAINKTSHLNGGDVRLSFRKSNIFDHLRNN